MFNKLFNKRVSLFQQGDVILEEVVFLPITAKKVKVEKEIVLAEGEVTGHKHTITVDNPELIELYEKDGQLFVKAKDNFNVLHQEHNTITVPQGIWKVRKVREYDHFEEEVRQVKD